MPVVILAEAQQARIVWAGLYPRTGAARVPSDHAGAAMNTLFIPSDQSIVRQLIANAQRGLAAIIYDRSSSLQRLLFSHKRGDRVLRMRDDIHSGDFIVADAVMCCSGTPILFVQAPDACSSLPASVLFDYCAARLLHMPLPKVWLYAGDVARGPAMSEFERQRRSATAWAPTYEGEDLPC